MVANKSLRDEMYSLVEQYHNRQGTQKEFYEEHNLKASQFPYWIMKYNRRENKVDKTSGFIRLNPKAKSDDNLTVTLPNGIIISGNSNDVVPTTAALYKMTK